MISITSNVFISSIDSVTLPVSNIAAVVSLLTPPLSSYPHFSTTPLPHHLFVPLSDTPADCLLSTLKQTLPFIHKHHENGVLVHCFHGISRSVATVLAYLIWLHPSTSLHVHLQHIRHRYPAANPSTPFLRQLHAFQASTRGAPHIYSFPPEQRMFHPLEANHLLILIAHFTMPACTTLFLHNPNNRNTCATCRICRAPLLSDLSMQTRSKYSIRVLPLKWMISSCAYPSGKLRCSCGAKVGRFDLNIPFFEIHTSTIDCT